MAKRPSKPDPASKADREFVSEAEEILEQMREGLADLEDQRTNKTEVAPEVINGLFRAAHTLKSLAGLFGFDPVRDLAHQLEDVLDGLRLGRVSLDSGAVGLIEDVVRLFASLLAEIGEPDRIAAAADQITELSEQIQALTAKDADVDVALDDLDLDPSFLRALTEYEEHRLRESVSRGRHIVLVDSAFEIISFEDGLGALSAALREFGEIISTLPSPGDSPDAQIRFSLLTASELSASEIRDRLEFPDAVVRSASRLPRERAPEASPDGLSQAHADVSLTSLAESAGSRDPAPAIDSLKSISDTVRVDISKLDELMNLVGELVIQRSAIGEIVQRLHAEGNPARIGTDLGKIYKSLDRKLRGLQAAVLDVRMVPLRQVFEKVSRVVRGLRRELVKDARLEVSGAGTELDKLIVEELVDPLMHIVRNAFDHAIEPAPERIAAGKDPQGCVRIDATQRGNHVVIEVSDDGRGIDSEALLARAEAAGLIARDVNLTDKEVLDLIFEPGLSTRDEVSETSGRGVGMDVVRSNLTQLGGTVDVRSVPGRGTTISMTLPITLAIIQSLVVSVEGQRFAIPLNSVLETLLIDTSEIQRSEGRELLNLRGTPLLLGRLADEFGFDSTPSADKAFVVVLGIADQRLGLLVGELEGQQDTIIKSIHGPIQSIRGVAGATELGDQDPVLVLDVAAIVEDAGRRRAVTT